MTHISIKTVKLQNSSVAKRPYLCTHNKDYYQERLGSMEQIRSCIRGICWRLGLDLTRNMKYDRMTRKIMLRSLLPDSNCIDVGSHKGDFLLLFNKYSPLGIHYAFEPIPLLYNKLKENFPKVHVFRHALGERNESSSFQFVRNAPAYSGLKPRHYEVKDPQVETLVVEVRTLDSLLPPDQKIDFIKIDVEGGELAVIRGAAETIRRWKPVMVFESGLGASEYYGTGPDDIFDLLQALGMQISLLRDYLAEENALSRTGFRKIYTEQSDYYFVGHPMS